MSLSLEMLTTLYEYSGWARDRILAAAEHLSAEQLRQAPETGAYGAILDTLVHMAASQWMWFERIRGRAPQSVPGAADFLDLPALRAWWDEIQRDSLAYLATLSEADLRRTVSYVNHRDGQTYTRITWHALLQVANHQTEHRSQVATMLSNLGVEVPATDLVVFLRQG